MAAPTSRPNLVQQGRYRWAVPPRRSSFPMPRPCIIPGVSERQLAAWARIWPFRCAAAISWRCAGISAPARRRWRAPSSGALCPDLGRGDPEPDLHAGADLCRQPHAGRAPRSLPFEFACGAGRARPRAGAAPGYRDRRMARAREAPAPRRPARSASIEDETAQTRRITLTGQGECGRADRAAYRHARVAGARPSRSATWRIATTCRATPPRAAMRGSIATTARA